MKWLICLLLCSVCFSSKANWLSAMEAYENARFAQAELAFSKLLTLGNEDAVFNLGVMAYNGEGQVSSLPLAAAYFQLATDLKHPEAERLYTAVSRQLSDEDKKQSAQHYAKLRSDVFFINYREQQQASVRPSRLKALTKVAPEYPKSALRDNLFGYVTLRLLVDGEGRVHAADAIDSYPAAVFDEVAIQAIKQWRYEATGRFHVQSAQFDFAISGGIRPLIIERWLKSSKLWSLAVEGSPAHQEALGTVLHVINTQSQKELNFFKVAEPDAARVPTMQALEAEAEFHFFVTDFSGKAIVQLARNGTITEVLDDSSLTSPAASQLIGQQVKGRGKIAAGNYVLRQSFGAVENRVSVEKIVDLPNTLDGYYWWRKAAKNGDLRAQRNLAARFNSWREYLLLQEDPVVMAWVGVDLLLSGEKDQGMYWLEKAIALHYPQASQLKTLLL
ncbi:energy transducer TonB [Alishewanella longhuensis]